MVDILETVKDPEVPVLSIMDLGIVRDVEWIEGDDQTGSWKITITPTYSGCPAMEMIATQIRMTLYAAGIHAFSINTVLSPAWTTDWMTEAGKEKLRAYGIAPPHPLPKHYTGEHSIDPGPLPVHVASLNIPTASANLAPLPAKHYTSVTIVKNLSIISSAINFAKTIHTPAFEI